MHGSPHTLDTLAPEQTWEALDAGVCIAWWQMTTFLAVEGEDAGTFLDGLCTQAAAEIPEGSTAYNLFLTSKARIIAPTLCYRAGPHRFLLELDPELAEPLHQHLRRHRLRSQVEIESTELATFSLLGPTALAASASGERPGSWFSSAAWGSSARTFVGSAGEVSASVAQLHAAGTGYADPEAVDAWRIDAGIPSLADLQPGFMPAEVGAMDAAVSLTKGCYLGQEPVARLHYRGHANRTLFRIGLAAEPTDEYFAATPPDSEDYLAIVRPGDAKRVGTLTSWARTPAGEVVGLAILRTGAADDTTLVLAGTQIGVRPKGPATPTTGPATPTTGPATPTKGPATPTTGPATPTQDPATPAT